MNLKLWVGRPLAPVPPEFRPSFRFDRVWDRWGFGAGVRHRRRPLLGLSHHRWSRVLVPGTAREAKERAVLGSRDHPFRAPDGGPARGRDRDRALRAALPPRGCATGETGDRRGKPAEWRATAADQLLAFTCCWPELEEPAQ